MVAWWNRGSPCRRGPLAKGQTSPVRERHGLNAYRYTKRVDRQPPTRDDQTDVVTRRWERSRPIGTAALVAFPRRAVSRPTAWCVDGEASCLDSVHPVAAIVRPMIRQDFAEAVRTSPRCVRRDPKKRRAPGHALRKVLTSTQEPSSTTPSPSHRGKRHSSG